MATVAEASADFLAQRRIAVAGVSRNAAGHGGNYVYKTLRKQGYEVFAVNPNADTVEGDTCYRDLASIPGGVDGVVIATNPTATGSVVDECIRLGIHRVWMHRSFGGGSVEATAVKAGRDAGLTVIAGACPLMFGDEGGHRPQVHALGAGVHQLEADGRLTARTVAGGAASRPSGVRHGMDDAAGGCRHRGRDRGRCEPDARAAAAPASGRGDGSHAATARWPPTSRWPQTRRGEPSRPTCRRRTGGQRTWPWSSVRACSVVDRGPAPRGWAAAVRHDAAWPPRFA